MNSVHRFAIISFTLAGVALFAFVSEIFGVFDVFQGQEVGQVVAAKGTVKRLAQGQLIWGRVFRTNPVGAGDTVATGENAGVRIQFYQGGEIELGPGAMMVIGGTAEKLDLNFVSGNAKVKIVKGAEKTISVKRLDPSLATQAVETGKDPKALVAQDGSSLSSIEVENVDRFDVKLKKSSVFEKFSKGLEPYAQEVLGRRNQKKTSDPAAPEGQVVAKEKSDLFLNEVEETDLESLGLNSPTKEGSEVASLVPLNQVDTEPVEKPSPARSPAALPKVEQKKVIQPLVYIPPRLELVSPPDQQVVEIGVQNGVELRWKAELPTAKKNIAEIKYPISYEILLQKQGNGGVTRVVRSTDLTFPIEKIASLDGEGRYSWSVRGTTADGKKIPTSRTRWIEIRRPVKIDTPTILPVQVE